MHALKRNRTQVTTPRLGLDVITLSWRGERHVVNEDYAAYHIRHVHPQRAVFAIADGMGSFQYGEKASRAAVASCLKHITRAPFRLGSAHDAIWQGFMAAQIAVQAIPRESHERVGSTMVAGVVWQGQMYLGWLGDSRVYHWRKNVIKQISYDHTRTQDLVESGQVSPENAASDPTRHLLTRYVGRPSGDEMNAVEMGTIDLDAGDVILMVTDGVTGVVPDNLLAFFCQLPTANQIARHILQRVKELRGNDDATMIVIRITRPIHPVWVGIIFLAGMAIVLFLIWLTLTLGAF